MSEPTLNQMFIAKDAGWEPEYEAAMELLIDAEMLVPVERCEHRRLDEHGTGYELDWCPGAGIGGRMLKPDYEKAVAYHNTMRDSLTDSEDHRNHAVNVVRYSLGLPLGPVTGDLYDHHHEFLTGIGDKHE